MEVIWSVVCGRVVKANQWPTAKNPTLLDIKEQMHAMGCPRPREEEVLDFRMSLLFEDDDEGYWNGESRVELGDVLNYEFADLREAIIRAYGHSRSVYLTLYRDPDPERDDHSVFASFLLAYQPKIQRPLGTKWSYTWEITNGPQTRITYGEVLKLYEFLKETKLLTF